MATRFYYLDNLRALAMILGVLFHAALAYASPINEFWFITDSNSTPLLSIFSMASHTFRMPLFFLIAGYFGRLIVTKRGPRAFIRNRLSRIGAPFLIFLPLLAIASVALIDFALAFVHEPSRLLLFIMQEMENPTGGLADVGTLHLWFLYYLLMFSFIAIGLDQFRSPRIDGLIATMFRRPWALLIAPAILVPALFVAGTPTPSPDRLGVMLWPFGYFGAFFCFGWLLHDREKLIDSAARHAPKFVLVALACFALHYAYAPTFSFPPTQVEFAPQLALSALKAFAAAYACMGLLTLGKRFADGERKGVRFIADASYWLYLIHLPLVILAQTLMANTAMPALTKFLLASGGPIAIGLLTYAVFVRYTPIGSLLNGARANRERKIPGAGSAQTG